jgi:hypothetical protein
MKGDECRWAGQKIGATRVDFGGLGMHTLEREKGGVGGRN